MELYIFQLPTAIFASKPNIKFFLSYLTCARKTYFSDENLDPLLREVFLIWKKKILLEKFSVNLSVMKTMHEEMVFCYQNCSDLLWEKIVLWLRKTFEIHGWRPRIFKHFDSEWSEQFLLTECFLTCSWRFLRTQLIEQL